MLGRRLPLMLGEGGPRHHSKAALVARKAMTEQLRSGMRLLHNKITTHHSMRSLNEMFTAINVYQNSAMKNTQNPPIRKWM